MSHLPQNIQEAAWKSWNTEVLFLFTGDCTTTLPIGIIIDKAVDLFGWQMLCKLLPVKYSFKVADCDKLDQMNFLVYLEGKLTVKNALTTFVIVAYNGEQEVGILLGKIILVETLALAMV